jgi:hypothetical protein
MDSDALKINAPATANSGGYSPASALTDTPSDLHAHTPSDYDDMDTSGAKSKSISFGGSSVFDSSEVVMDGLDHQGRGQGQGQNGGPQDLPHDDRHGEGDDRFECDSAPSPGSGGGRAHKIHRNKSFIDTGVLRDRYTTTTISTSTTIASTSINTTAMTSTATTTNPCILLLLLLLLLLGLLLLLSLLLFKPI